MYVESQHATVGSPQGIPGMPRSRRSWLALGDTNGDVLQTLCPGGVGKSPCQTKSVSVYTAFLQQAISSRFLPQPNQQNASTTCSGSSATGATTATKALNITKATAGTAAGITSTLAATIPALSVVPPIAVIAGIVAGIASIFTAHHAQAEATQADLLCTLVPQVNSALSSIDQGLADGTISPSQASTQYSQILGSFTSGVKSDPSFKTGDALYGFMQALQGVIAARNEDLQNGVLTGGAAAPWASSSGSGSIASALESAFNLSSLPSWAPWALGGAAVLLVFAARR